MPKRNPKHNAVHVSRAVKKNTLTIPKFQVSNTLGVDVKFIPTLPTKSELNRAKQKNHDLLFRIEESIMTWVYEFGDVDDSKILNAVGYILLKCKQWDSLIEDSTIPQSIDERLHPAEKVLVGILLDLIHFLRNRNKPYSASRLRLCFACIYDSVRFWSSQNGPTGYIDYVSQFVPPGMGEDILELMDDSLIDEEWDGEEQDDDEWFDVV